MSLTTRILPPEEWERLNSPTLPPTFPYADPANVDVVVVEDEGEIVGTMTVLKITHLEGGWVAPSHRGKAGVIRALLRQSLAIPQMRGERWVIGASADEDPTVGKFWDRLGGNRMRMGLWALPLAQEEACRQQS